LSCGTGSAYGWRQFNLGSQTVVFRAAPPTRKRRMISDFITWSLLIGQAILIGMCATGIGWDAFRATETPAQVWGFVVTVLLAGGVIGTVGHRLVVRYWFTPRSINCDTKPTVVARRERP
jgi:hypothetical protein